MTVIFIFRFIRKDSLHRHIRRAHSSSGGTKELHRCPNCDSTFTKHINLAYHISSQHQDLKQEFNCPMCPGVTFVRQKSLAYHMFKVHSKKPARSCGICKKKLACQDGLVEHMEQCHPGIATHNKTLCLQCNKDFKTESKLYYHKNIAHGNEEIVNVATAGKCCPHDKV